MAKEKACKTCKTLFEGAACPACGGEGIDTFKGKVLVFNPEQSEVAQKLNLKNKGRFAVRLR